MALSSTACGISSAAAQSCRGIGRSSRSAMNGRVRLSTISPFLRQANPVISAVFTLPSAIDGRLCNLGHVLRTSSRSKLVVRQFSPRGDPAGRGWSGQARQPGAKSRAGKARMVSTGMGVTCVPNTMVLAPRAFARKTPYMSFSRVGAVIWVR